MNEWLGVTLLLGLPILVGGAFILGLFSQGLFIRLKGLYRFRSSDWEIGVFMGATPFTLASRNDAPPVILTASDVLDAPARMVADPFAVRKDQTWYLFFEMLDIRVRQGVICLATSDDTKRWSYRGIVLQEPFHLSYPHIFEWENEWYMLPETCKAGTLRLYKAMSFPMKWTFHQTLIDGHFADPTLLHVEGRWWLFANTSLQGNKELRLFYASSPKGPWAEHPASPVVQGDATRARPAGSFIEVNGRLFRLAQDCKQIYGRCVEAIEITKLTETEYEEAQESISVASPSGSGWNAKRMHHVDAHEMEDGQWIAFVDGNAN